MHRFRARGLLFAFAACSVSVAAKPPSVPPAPAQRVAPLSPEAMVEAVQAEKDALMRRLDVCTQLRRVAAGTNDAKLEAEALQLEQMAETTYKQRVAKLGVKATNPRSPASQLESLDRVLGGGAAVSPLAATRPAPPAGPATAKSGNFKVVNP